MPENDDADETAEPAREYVIRTRGAYAYAEAKEELENLDLDEGLVNRVELRLSAPAFEQGPEPEAGADADGRALRAGRRGPRPELRGPHNNPEGVKRPRLGARESVDREILPEEVEHSPLATFVLAEFHRQAAEQGKAPHEIELTSPPVAEKIEEHTDYSGASASGILQRLWGGGVLDRWQEEGYQGYRYELTDAGYEVLNGLQAEQKALDYAADVS